MAKCKRKPSIKKTKQSTQGCIEGALISKSGNAKNKKRKPKRQEPAIMSALRENLLHMMLRLYADNVSHFLLKTTDDYGEDGMFVIIALPDYLNFSNGETIGGEMVYSVGKTIGSLLKSWIKKRDFYLAFFRIKIYLQY